jgi:hypothetical protein
MYQDEVIQQLIRALKMANHGQSLLLETLRRGHSPRRAEG